MVGQENNSKNYFRAIKSTGLASITLKCCDKDGLSVTFIFKNLSAINLFCDINARIEC